MNAPTHRWYRLSVDVDATGGPVGSSIEVHDGDRITAVHVLPAPGPFDELSPTFTALVDEVVDRYGVQLTLWSDASPE